MKNKAKHNVTMKKCEDIQKSLLAYMTRELGKAPSELVSRHLRKCKACQAEAAEVRATLKLLRQESRAEPHWPSRLSDEHRRRIAWTMDHPALDWLCARHAAVSILVALLVVLAVLGLAWRAARVRQDIRVQETVYPITIGRPPFHTNHTDPVPENPAPEDVSAPEATP